VTWRVLIADDHEVTRIGIRELLEQQQNIIVCAEAADGMQALATWRNSQPDIVILDDELPKINGMVVAERILKREPKQRIVVFGTMQSRHVVQQFLKAGVRSLISKTDPVSELLKAVRAVQQNRIYFTKAVDDFVLGRYLKADDLHNPSYQTQELTLREQEVIQLIAEGRSTKEVASALHIRPKTAETHRQNAMSKLGVHNAAQLTRHAIANGMVEAFTRALPACADLQEGSSRPWRLAAASAKAA
jgi:DNA-binding NarL/FixJ family response regulator